MKYSVIDAFRISGRGIVYLVEFDNPYSHKEILKLMNTKIYGQTIIGIELAAKGESCTFGIAGLLVRNEKDKK